MGATDPRRIVLPYVLKWPDTSFQSLLDAAPDAMLVINQAWEIVVANAKAEKLFGYSREELTGRSVESLISPRSPDQQPHHRENFVGNPRVRSMGVGLEPFALRGDGTQISVEISLSPLTTESGTFVISAIRDVTELRRLEELKKSEAILRETRESEARFRSAAQVGKMFAYEWDIATDLVVRSGESVQILGIDEAMPTTGQELMAKVHSDDREKVTAAIAELNPEKSHLQISYRRVRPDGTVIWVERIGHAHFDERGRMVRMIGMTADITERKVAETELALANDRLRLVMEAAKSVGWDRDVRTGHDTLFGDLQSMFGIPSEVYGGRVEDFHRYLHPEDRGRVLEAIDDAMQAHKPYAAEFRILRPDGTVRWVGARGKFYYTPDGEPERMLGMSIDITGRKLAEGVLRQKEKELSEAQRLAQIGSWEWDPNTDTVTWSRELYRIVGRDPSLPAVSYKDHSQLYTAESMKKLKRAVEEALRNGTPYELEMEMVHPDGPTTWVRARGEVQHDVTGQIVRLRGTVQDITERKLADETLRESEERLHMAVQAGKMYGFDWDVTTDVIIRSEEATHIPGLIGEPLRLTKQQLSARVHPEDRPIFNSTITDCTPERPNHQISFRLLRPDGSVLWLERTGHAFFDEQRRMVRMTGMVADVTERKLAEEALSKVGGRLIEAQEEERAWIARELHDDIGQQLALLANNLALMAQDPPDSAAEIRNCTQEHLKRVHEIAVDLQAISHRLHSSKLQLLGIVAAAKSFCQELSEQHKVEIDFTHADIPPAVPEEISLCLFRVMQEALQNAVKHSGVRHFDVELRGAPDWIHLTVRDAGLGFDPEAVVNNRGLGLVSMQERVNLVKGTISITSRPQSGTEIRVRVPLSAGEQAEQAKSAGA